LQASLKVLPLTMGEIQGTLLHHPHLFRFLLFFLHFHYRFLHLHCSILL